MPSSYKDLNSKSEKFNSDREARYKKPKISAPPQQFDTQSVMTRALLFLYIQGALGFDSERQSVNAAARGRRPTGINDTSPAAGLRRRLTVVDHLDEVARVREIDRMVRSAMAKSQSGNDAVVTPDNEVPARTSDVPAQGPHSIPASEEHNAITQTILRPGEREDVAIPLEKGFLRQVFHELQTGQSRDAVPIPASQGNPWFGAEAAPVTKGRRRKKGYSPVYSYSLFGPSSTRSNVGAGDAINKLLNYPLYEEMGGELKNKVTEVVNGLKVRNKVSYAQLLMDMQRVIYTLIGEHGKSSKKMFDLMLAQEEIAVQMFNYGGVDLVNQNDDILETPEEAVNPEYIEQRFNPNKNITGHGNVLNQREGYLFPPVATERGNDYEGVISAKDAAQQIHNNVPFKDIINTAKATINKNRLSRQKHPSEASVSHWQEVEKLYYKDAYKIDVVVDQKFLEKREYFLLYRTLLHFSLLEKSHDSTSNEYAELQADKQYAQDIAKINTLSYTYLLNLNYDKLKRVAEACEGVDKKLWPLHTSELARETVGDNVEDLYLFNALIFKLINANCFNKNTALLLRPVDALKEYTQINPIAILPEKQTTSESSDNVKSYQGFKNSTSFTKQSDYNHQFVHYINENSKDEAKNITSRMELSHPVDAPPVSAYTYGFSVHHQTGWLARPNRDNADVLPGRIGVVRFSDESLYVTAFIEGELREKLYNASEASANPVLSTMSRMKQFNHITQASNRGTRRDFSWQTDSLLRGESLYKYLLDSLWGSFIESPVSDYNFPFAELVFNTKEHQVDIKGKNLSEIVTEFIHLALVDTAHVTKQRLWLKSDAQEIAENILPLYKTLYAEFTDEMHEMNWQEFLGELALLALQFAPIGLKFAGLTGRVTLQIRQVVNAYRAQGLRGAALAKASAPSVMNIAVRGALQAGKLLARGAWEAVDPYPIDFMQQLGKAPRSVLNSRIIQNFGSPLIQSALDKARKMKNLEQALIKKGAVCWDGAVRFQHKAGLISTDTLTDFNQAKVRAHNYVAFIGDEPQLIHSASELKTVPVGSRIGIIAVDGSELKHAMVLLDGSTVGGINNGYLGKSPGWEEIKLTDVLRWEPDGSIRLNNMPDNVKFVLVAEGGAYVGSGIPTPVKRWTETIQGPAVKRQPDSGANIGDSVDKSAEPREFDLNLEDLASCLGTGGRSKRSPGGSGGCRVVSGQSGGNVIELESPTRELTNNRPKLQEEEFERLMHVREVGKDPVTHLKTTGFVRIVTDDFDLDHLTGPYSAKFVLLKGPEGPKLVIGAIHQDSNVKIFSHPALTRFGSQSSGADLPVLSAGYIGRSSDGNTFVVNVSGHYQPKASDLKPMTEYLSKIGVRNPVIVGGGSELLAKVHYLWLRDGKLYRKNIFQ